MRASGRPRGRHIEAVVPAWGWLRRYRRGDLSRDVSAGVLLAVIVIPQGMAYALLAGLPPIYGLYATIAPAVLYAVFGTSRHMPVGPVAIVALLTFSGVSSLAAPQSDRYVSLALVLALVVGALQLLLGVFRLGFVTNFVPRPVLSGFIFASVILIMASQLQDLLGIDHAGRHSFISTLAEVAGHIGATNLPTMGIGLGSILALVLIRKAAPRLPGPLLVTVAATLVVYLLGLAGRGVDVLGHVPSGFPAPTLPPLNIKTVRALAPTALAVVFVSFIESFAVAKSVAAKEKYKIDSNQELRALGLANISAGLFSGFPVAGSFSRTAINHQAGARTQLAGVVTAIVVVLTLLFLTPLLYYLPTAVLAAIIVVAVYRMLDLGEVKHIARIREADGLVLLVTFALTLFVGIVDGILLGALFGLLAFLKRTVRPDVTELGYVPESDAFLGLRSSPKARTDPRVLILRFDASPYYANVSFLQEWVMRTVAERTKLEHIIIDCRGMNSIDVTALDELDGLITDYRSQGITVLLTHVKLPLRERLTRAGWNDKFGADVIGHATSRQALDSIGLLEGMRNRTQALGTGEVL
jgi:SulP family sulfate permease